VAVDRAPGRGDVVVDETLEGVAGRREMERTQQHFPDMSQVAVEIEPFGQPERRIFEKRPQIFGEQIAVAHGNLGVFFTDAVDRPGGGVCGTAPVPQVRGQIPQPPHGFRSVIKTGKVASHRAEPILKLIPEKPVADEADGKFIKDEGLTVGRVFPPV